MNGISNKGKMVAVDPIRDRTAIESIKKLLSDEPRNHLLFVLGINNGLRTGDLLKLKAGQLRGLKPGDSIRIKEGKTGKVNVLMINKGVHKSLKRYFDIFNPDDDDYIFQSRKGENIPLTTTSVNNLIKKWTKAVNLKGTYGAHSLRKTFGYIQRTQHGTCFDVLCKRFNHSSPAVTQRYLGIEDKEVNGILLNEI